MNLVKITRESGIPLIGSIMFGIVDRGSNLIQVRPSTACNLNCRFCSTDAGPWSSQHKTNYVVDVGYLVEEVEKVVAVKGKTHVNIDSVGEPTAYPDLVKLVRRLSKIPDVFFISMQTNGTLLNKKLIEDLEEAGLRRIHLSVHAVNPELAKLVMGAEQYKLDHVFEVARWIQESRIELLLAPVWLPRVNDQEIESLVRFAKELGCKIGIQKYEVYKHSRKMKEAKKDSYYHFYEKLKALEKKYGVKLVYSARDLEVGPAPGVPKPIGKDERLSVIVCGQGWYPGQMIASCKGRTITINHCKKSVGDRVNVRVVENKHNIYVAEVVS